MSDTSIDAQGAERPWAFGKLAVLDGPKLERAVREDHYMILMPFTQQSNDLGLGQHRRAYAGSYFPLEPVPGVGERAHVLARLLV